MQQSKNKILIGVLAGLVVILLVAVAFLLGKNAGQTNPPAVSDQPSASGAPEAPGSVVPGQETGTATPADSATTDSGANTNPAPAVTVPAPGTDFAPVAGVPKNLIVDMTSGSLTVVQGTAFDVRYDDSVIRMTNDGETLMLSNVHSDPSASQRRKMDVTLTLPSGHLFDSANVTLGAGKLTVRSLAAKTLKMELGAGSTDVDSLFVTESAKIQTGAGGMSVNHGSIANLTLECGAGATNLSAALTGTNRVNALFGALNLNLDGNKEDYTVSFNISLGACFYNGTQIARNGTFGEGATRVDISGGLGIMHVNVG